MKNDTYWYRSLTICTTSAPSGDGMFVLGHVENLQTAKHPYMYILFVNFSAFLLKIFQHPFFIKIKAETTYIQYNTTGIPNPGQN